MKKGKLIVRSLWYYRWKHLAVALGMSVGMAVITGALVTGDSVRAGLKNLVTLRLGNVTHVVTSGDRYMTDSLAGRLSEGLGVPAAAVLQVEGSVTAGGGTVRLPAVNVFGVDQAFGPMSEGHTLQTVPKPGEAILNDHAASLLGLKVGDEILLRLRKPELVPLDAPFVSDENNILSLRITVSAIAERSEGGRFSLTKTQGTPVNLFIDKTWLQQETGLPGRCNRVLLADRGNITRPEISRVLAESLSLPDISLHLTQHETSREWLLRTPRIFLDPPVLHAIQKIETPKDLYFSYFVNQISTGSLTTPYSFVSTLPGERIPKGHMVINQWLAEDLQVGIGDSLTLRYFQVGPLRNLTEEKASFRVSEIVSMASRECDSLLMPEIPGLSDAGDCRDWETSIPIDLTKIRDKDEEYWNRHRGMPKAFIRTDEAERLWSNRFGAYTQVRFTPEIAADSLAGMILGLLSPTEAGISVEESYSDGVAAASGGVDFSGLFLGLSFFLILGGILLTILLIRLSFESRMDQVGLLKALGWSALQIRNLYLLETFLITLLGVLIGLVLTLGYTAAIFKALNSIWNEIVLTDTLKPVFLPSTLMLGVLSSLILSMMAAFFALRRYFRHRTADLQKSLIASTSGRKNRILIPGGFLAGIASLVLSLIGLFSLQSVPPTFFFLAGTLLLAGFLMIGSGWAYKKRSMDKWLNLRQLSFSNLSRNPGRTLTVFILFSLGVYLVIAIGSYRKMETDSKPTSGTGGFDFVIETTVPVLEDLNKPETRAKFGLTAGSRFVQLKKIDGDDASCLNLNRVSTPPLLGIPEGSLTGRFGFVSTLDPLEKEGNPWAMLEEQPQPDVLPAFADMTVIQWGLGLKLGDTLDYQTENGKPIRIVLKGGLANSVFQGHLLISAQACDTFWPSVSGTRWILADSVSNEEGEFVDEFSRAFRDYGTSLLPAREKLATFNAVENTYLSIFLVLGALAILLGTIGLAIVLLRNLQERRRELVVMRASGFPRSKLIRMIAWEYTLILLAGTLAGGLPGLLSVIPMMLNPAGGVSPVFLGGLVSILFLHGWMWILLFANRFVSRIPVSG